MPGLVGSDPGWFGFRVLNANESLLNNSKERGLSTWGLSDGFSAIS